MVAVLLGLPAVAQQNAPVVISELYEYKIVIAVGPIEKHNGEYTISTQTDIEIEETAEYGCSIYGRQSYPINVSESNACNPMNALFGSEQDNLLMAMEGCMKYYLYACGTH